jgi:hypothetical protein
MLRALVLLIVLSFALPVRAQATSAGDPADFETTPAPRYLDYRLYLLATDAAALTFVIGGAALQNQASMPVVYTGVAAYALGAPMVHVAHEQPERALGSLGMRLGFPVLGAALGYGLTAATCDPNTSGEFGCLGAAVLFIGGGFFGGVLSAMIVDDAILGKVELTQTRERAGRSSPRLGVAPFLAPKAKGMGITVAGAF